MKKNLKNIIIIAVLLIFAFATVVQADTNLSWDSIKKDADSFIKTGEGKKLIDDSKIVNNVVPIGQMLTTVGVVVLFGSLLILGIKYMKAQPEERGKLKQQLIGVAISGVVIFGAYSIWKLVYDFFKEALN